MTPKQEEKLDKLCEDMSCVKQDITTMKKDIEDFKRFKWTITGIASGISIAAGAIWTFLTKAGDK